MDLSDILADPTFDPEDFIRYATISRADTSIMEKLVREFPVLLNVKVHGQLVGNWFSSLFGEIMKNALITENHELIHELYQFFPSLTTVNKQIIGEFGHPKLIDKIVANGMCNDKRDCLDLLGGYRKNRTPFRISNSRSNSEASELVDSTVDHFYRILRDDSLEPEHVHNLYPLLINILSHRYPDKLSEIVLENIGAGHQSHAYDAIRKINNVGHRVKLVIDLMQIPGMGSKLLGIFIRKLTAINEKFPCPIGCNKPIKSWSGLSLHVKKKHGILIQWDARHTRTTYMHRAQMRNMTGSIAKVHSQS